MFKTTKNNFNCKVINMDSMNESNAKYSEDFDTSIASIALSEHVPLTRGVNAIVQD